jgi:hypothetical protein
MLFAHHMAVELFGHEFAPETPMEHAVAFGIVGLALLLMTYGAFALVRDIGRRWRGESRRTAIS